MKHSHAISVDTVDYARALICINRLCVFFANLTVQQKPSFNVQRSYEQADDEKKENKRKRV